MYIYIYIYPHHLSRARSGKHPDFSTLAARIAVSNLHKSPDDVELAPVRRRGNLTGFV